MIALHSRSTRVAAVLSAAALVLAGCVRGSQSGSNQVVATGASGQSPCPDVLTAATAAVQKATDVKAPWTGPTSGPKAAAAKLVVYVAQTMTNPGVAAVAAGLQEAGKAIGWNVRVIDGQGDQADTQAAFGQALALKPAGIIIGGFDPNTTSAQMAQAKAANIPIVGWHAVADPGPSKDPDLFTNVTVPVEAVSKISAQWIIAKSQGTAGVVVFTDNSIPFAAGKAKLLESDLTACAGVKILSVQNIPIPDAGTRTPQAFSSLVTTLGSKWTYSVAINDLYFDNAATPLRAAGKDGDGVPYNVGAGDGSPAAFQRIASKQYQAATVPDPLKQEGWQIIDELNRSFNNQPPSGYVPEAHVTDPTNVGSTTEWDPQNGYQDAYKKIWGK